MNPDDIQKAILQELGIAGWPEDKQKEALAVVGGPIIQSITLSILEKLPAEKRAEFSAALERGDATAVATLIQTHIPDSNAYIEGEARKALQELKSLMGAQT